MTDLPPPVAPQTVPPAPRPYWERLKRPLLFVALVSVATGCYVVFREELTLGRLVAWEQWLDQAISNEPIAVVLGAVALFVAVTGASIPIATALTIVYGWLFGFWLGLLVVSFSSTAGATISFLLSRWLFRENIRRKFGPRLLRVEETLRREGPYYLFLLRLLPFIPYFVVNIMMGISPLRTVTFWWVTQLGMLPEIAIYTYAGSQLPSLERLAADEGAGILTPQLVVALLLLGLFPLAVHRLLPRREI